tara:strand:+ start:1725 stop:1916 length:192 start_codon:yes stop_codon:yes gene_type:complete
MKDSQEQATVMFKLTAEEAKLLMHALRNDDAPPIHDRKDLHNRLNNAWRTMRAVNNGNAKGWK